MNKFAAAVLAVASIAALGSAADAKGCIKGALVGGIAGHMAGHGMTGAAAGCAIGHHRASKKAAAAEQTAPDAQK